MLRGLFITTLGAAALMVAPSSALAGANQDIAVTPINIPFEDRPVGTTSDPVTVTVSNGPTSITLTVNQPTITGDAAQYSIVNDGCASYPRMLIAGASCTLGVEYHPTGVGTHIAFLNIPSNDPDEPTTSLQLTGDGLPPPIVDLTVARAGSATVLGDEVYEETPFIQVLSKRIKRQRTREFVVNVGNDGEVAGINVLGCAGENGFKVTYDDLGTDVTDAIVAGTYETEEGPGREILMRVKAKKSARGTLECTVTGSAYGSANDAVQVKLKAKR